MKRLISKNRLSGFILLIVGSVCLFACTYNAGLVQSTYKLLLTSQVSYDTGMKIAADLYRQGRISDSEKVKIIEVGTIYAEAHNASVKALASYEKTKSAADQERMTAQIAVATTALSKLLELLRPYLEVK